MRGFGKARAGPKTVDRWGVHHRGRRNVPRDCGGHGAFPRG